MQSKYALVDAMGRGTSFAVEMRGMGLRLAMCSAACALVWGAGCGVGGVQSGDDDPSPDAAPDETIDAGEGEETGVTVEFVSLGPDGDPAEGDDPLEFEMIVIETVTVQLHELELIGDTAPAGQLVVPSRAVGHGAGVSRIAFAAAPPGLYSRLSFDIERAYADEELPEGFDGERLSIRVTGSARVQGPDREFIFTDDQKVSVNLDLAAEVTPGEPGTILVALDIDEWFAGTDWETLSGNVSGNDPILIGMGNEEATAATLRSRAIDAFEVDE